MSKQPSVGHNKAPCIVINDASCLIDLHKGGILLAMLALPYRFQVALPVRQNELLTIAESDWADLLQGGLDVVDLPGEAIAEAADLQSAHVALSLEDCFSLVLARHTTGAMLLTGDGRLKAVAKSKSLEVHGVLWVIDELMRLSAHPPPLVRKCLEVWQADPLVWLPGTEISARLRRLQL